MPLLKLSELDDYHDISGNDDIKGFDVYSDLNNDKVGTVADILVDDDGNFRYLIIDLGFWIFGKKVLLPVGRSRIDYGARRVYGLGMSKEQAENLPEFKEDQAIDYDYEENVRGSYRNVNTTATTPTTGASADLPLTTATTGAIPDVPLTTPTTYDRNTYSYQQEPSLYGINEQDHQNLRLYQERLIANKQRMKTGEVTVGKRVETETARVSVPVEKERVVIERTTPVEAGTAVTPGEADFRDGEVARIEVYEETPDIHKEAFVREEVRVRKEVDRDTVEAEDTIRREELDVNTQGNPVIDKRPDLNTTDRI